MLLKIKCQSLVRTRSHRVAGRMWGRGGRFAGQSPRRWIGAEGPGFRKVALLRYDPELASDDAATESAIRPWAIRPQRQRSGPWYVWRRWMNLRLAGRTHDAGPAAARDQFGCAGRLHDEPPALAHHQQVRNQRRLETKSVRRAAEDTTCIVSRSCDALFQRSITPRDLVATPRRRRRPATPRPATSQLPPRPGAHSSSCSRRLPDPARRRRGAAVSASPPTLA